MRVSSIAGRVRRGGVWRATDFRKLWAGLSISLIGSQFTYLALPLLAVLTLNASPVQMGLLAAGRLPYLLVILPHLYLVAFGVGTLRVLGEVAHSAYAPALIDRDRRVAGNSTLMIRYTASSLAGPGLAGLVIQFVSTSLALLVDAVSFVVSALLLRTIRRSEPHLNTLQRPDLLGGAIEAGLRALLDHPLLRPTIVAATVAAVFKGALDALYVLFASSSLGLNPATIGLVFTVGGLCADPAALLAPWAA